MALSGTLYSGNFGSGEYRLRLVWNATQSVANNQSTVNVTLYLDSLASWAEMFDGTNSDWNIKIDGETKSGTAQSDVSGNGSTQIGSYSRTVNHNSDGSKTLNISGSHHIDYTWSGSFIGTQSVSGDITLNRIPRASSVSIQGGSAEMGKYNDLYIKINRHHSAFTHTIKWTFGGKSGTVAEKITWVDHEWTVPADLATEVPNSTSGTGTITVETYDGDTHIGTGSTSFTATVPNNANYNPTLTVPTHTETNTSVTNAVGDYYVQGKSKIEVKATGGTKYGASIRSINFKIGSSNHTGKLNGTTGTTTSSPIANGAHAVVATITDSRGRTATSETSFTVTAYSPPSITGFRAFRKDSFSNTIESSASASMSAIGSENTVTLTVKTSPKGQDSWTTAKTVTATTGTSISTGVFNINNMSITSSYDVKLDVSDELTTSPTTQIIAVGTAVFPMSWSKIGIGVGKVWERGSLDVRGEAFFDGSVEITQDLGINGVFTPNGGFGSISIPKNADLNDYHNVGYYHSSRTADAKTMKNIPHKNAFSLLVEKHAGTKQTFTNYQTGNPSTWIRNFYSGSWGGWNRVAVDQVKRELPLSGGYTGAVSYQYDGINTNIFGWISKSGEVRGDQFLGSMVAEWAPQTDLRIPMAPWEGNTSYPEQHSGTLLIAGNGDISVMRKSGIDRFYFNTTFKARVR